MDINRKNYEAFLLDLVEGRLNAEETQQVRDFLQLNPDCVEGLDQEQYWSLKSELVSFPGKAGLRKEFPSHTSELSKSDFGLFSIARLEGDLTREQELEYARMVEGDKNKYQEWLAWKQTKLIGEAIVYEGKGRLKKKPKRSPAMVWISVVSAAAAVALIIALVRIGPGTSEPVMPEPELTSELEINPQEPSVILSDEPVTLSIRKHQEPPELTGKDKDAESVIQQSDSAHQEVQEIHEQEIKIMPVKVARLQKYPMNIVQEGIYDRITPLDLPPVSSMTGTLTWARFSQKGLKQTYKDFIDEKNLSLLTVASAGIDGINRLTGADLALNISRNDAGEVSGFRFRSNRLKVVAPVEKSE